MCFVSVHTHARLNKDTHAFGIMMSSAECFGHQINPLSGLECKRAKHALGMFTRL